MPKEYYCDNAATTKIDPEALKTMNEVSTKIWGNPSSHHTPGFTASVELDTYTMKTASLLGIKPEELYFTSGGTESDNWAVKGAAWMMWRKYGRRTILYSATEHPAIINSCKSLAQFGFNVEEIKVTREGLIDMDHLRSLMTKDLAVACVMRANNETGIVQDTKSIGYIVKLFGGIYICDAVQAVGKIDNGQIETYGADIVTFSAHKFHGPRGVGGMYIREGLEIDNLIDGGGQQNGHRSGTEILPLIAGMYVALRNVLSKERENEEVLNNLVRLLDLHLLIDYTTNNNSSVSIILNTPMAGFKCVPGLSNVSFKNISGDMLAILLNEHGIYVSTGSACHEDRDDPSHVLKAMNVPKDYIMGTIRFSLSPDMTEDDINNICIQLKECVADMSQQIIQENEV